VRTWTREELEELCELAKSNPDQFLWCSLDGDYWDGRVG
jgi:hypothetical protein